MGTHYLPRLNRNMVEPNTTLIKQSRERAFSPRTKKVAMQIGGLVVGALMVAGVVNNYIDLRHNQSVVIEQNLYGLHEDILNTSLLDNMSDVIIKDDALIIGNAIINHTATAKIEGQINSEVVIKQDSNVRLTPAVFEEDFGNNATDLFDGHQIVLKNPVMVNDSTNPANKRYLVGRTQNGLVLYFNEQNAISTIETETITPYDGSIEPEIVIKD